MRDLGRPRCCSSVRAVSDANCVRTPPLTREDAARSNILLILRAVKNIVLAGFGNITLLDLDTIDLSNLNRQFLFRKKDVKQSKAMVWVSLQVYASNLV